VAGSSEFRLFLEREREGGSIMRFILWLSLLFAGFAIPAQAESKAIWSTAHERTTFNNARISFPAAPAGLSIKETKEYSHPGTGLDASVRYESPDGQVFATVYVYLPGLAHPGLAAIATDQAIRSHSSSPVTGLGTQIVAAGGTLGDAVRVDYSGYMGNLASIAAYIKADRWIVKLRVSGPEQRKAEVEAAMAALLNGLRFEGSVRPWPAAAIEASACPAGDGPDAPLLADSKEEVFEATIFYGSLDPMGTRPGDRSGTPLPSRIGGRWCRETIEAGAAKIPVLRAMVGDLAEGTSVFLVPYSDSGGLLEVVYLKTGRFQVVNHDIALTAFLGTYGATPSLKQLTEILTGRGDAGRTRTHVGYKANGDTNVVVPPFDPAPSTPSPTT
jgi:hypothetical protein